MAACLPHPDPSLAHPLPAHPRVVFLKAVVDAPNVEIGDFSYYDDPVEPERFYEKCVLYHYPFLGERLVIGRFVAIATGVTFIMGGANHLMGGISTFPFQIFGAGWDKDFDMAPIVSSLRGDTVVGNDVWIGRQATILPGVRIGDGAIIGANAVVGSDVPPFAVVVGNPARVVRRRFDEETVRRLLAIAWWHWPAERITQHLKLIMGADVDALEQVSREAT